MKSWDIKIYKAYAQPFLPWLIIEFAVPWAIFGLFIGGLWYNISVGKFFNVRYLLADMTVLLVCLLNLFLGLFQRSIDVLLLSPSKIWVAMDGIYGKSMCARYFLYFAKPRLLARWEEIDKVILKKYPFCLNNDVCYVEIIKKDGSKFHISIHGGAPMNWRLNQLDFLRDKTDSNFCLELFGIVAWKIGLERFEGFPEEESKLLNGIRKRPLSMEGFKRVIQSIEVGVNGGAREDLPYKKMDEEWRRQ